MWKNVAQFLKKYFGGFAENATGDFKEELAESTPGDLREVPASSVSSKDLREASMKKYHEPSQKIQLSMTYAKITP